MHLGSAFCRQHQLDCKARRLSYEFQANILLAGQPAHEAEAEAFSVRQRGCHPAHALIQYLNKELSGYSECGSNRDLARLIFRVGIFQRIHEGFSDDLADDHIHRSCHKTGSCDFVHNSMDGVTAASEGRADVMQHKRYFSLLAGRGSLRQLPV